MCLRTTKTTRASRWALIAGALAMFMGVGPQASADPVRGLESSLAILELYVTGDEYTKTPEYAARISESILGIGTFIPLSREDTSNLIEKTVTSSGRRDTDEKLKRIGQELKQGEQLVYEDPQKAIEVLGNAKADLIMIMDQLALNKKIRTDLFLTQMLLARSHQVNGNRNKAKEIMGQIIRTFGKEEKPTDETYHPEIVALWNDTFNDLAQQRHGTITVRTEPAGATIFINGREQPLKSPATYQNLYPGPVTVVAKMNDRESLVHRSEIVLDAEKTPVVDIDIEFDDSRAFDGERFGLVFPDTETLDRRLADFASRIGKDLKVDYVLVTGLMKDEESSEDTATALLKGYLVDVAEGTVEKQESLTTKVNVVSPNMVDQLAKMLSGVEYTPVSLESSEWYENWFGWGLAGGSVVSAGVALGMFLNYSSNASSANYWKNRWEDAPQNQPAKREEYKANETNAANAANTSSYVAGAMLGVSLLAATGSVLVFIFMTDSGEEEVALYPPPSELKLQYVGPTMLPNASPGVGLGFTF